MIKTFILEDLKKYGFLLFSLILIVFGIITLKNGVENGIDSANLYLRTSMDGSMDTDSYLIITKGYILSNIILGGITLLFGLVFSSIYLFNYLKKST